MPSGNASEEVAPVLTAPLERKKRGPSPAPAPLLLLSAGQVAEILGCSIRHVYRLADGGRMPSPLRLGGVGSRIFPRWSLARVVTLAPGNRG